MKTNASTWKSELWDWIKTIVVAFVVVTLLNLFVFNLSIVKGQSMEPTLVSNERLFVNKIVYEFKPPQNGDIVVLRDPTEGMGRKDFLVKRIIGIPGDTVEVRDSQLYINGQLTEEEYIDVQIQDPDFGPISLTEDEYFVMGDNRHLGASKDSRLFGSVSLDEIIGRAEFILWPLNKIKGL